MRELTVQALIGVHPHEKRRRQPLVVAIEVEVAESVGSGLAGTVDYEVLVAHAERIAGEGHIGLVETFTRRLAQACLEAPRARRVRVRVEKPRALGARSAVAGVEVIVSKD
ncbi:MAG: dihydroneopterin aldolase [Caulobacteraceae bacterium]